jgi:hypothetical protein
MMVFLEELVVCIAVSLGVRAVTTVAEVLFVPGKTTKPAQPQTCDRCGKAMSVDLETRRNRSVG